MYIPDISILLSKIEDLFFFFFFLSNNLLNGQIHYALFRIFKEALDTAYRYSCRNETKQSPPKDNVFIERNIRAICREILKLSTTPWVLLFRLHNKPYRIILHIDRSIISMERRIGRINGINKTICTRFYEGVKG